jgi:hydroxymethylpyrimidine pyrophosphatase-like HAD family hydrolase
MTQPLEAPRALFMTDLDGTLLGPEGVLPDRNREAVLRALEQGIQVTVITGRRRSSILEKVYPILEGLGLRIAGSNGAVVLAPDNFTVEAVHGVDWAIADQVAGWPELMEQDVIGILSPPLEPDNGIPDCVVLEAGSRRWLTSWTPLEKQSLVEVDRRAVRTLPLVHLAVFADSRDEADRIVRLGRQRLPEQVSLHVVQSLYGRVALAEVVPRGGKGLALRHLMRRLGVPQHATAAIGDELNDCDLLDAAQHGYAVGGSVLAARRPEVERVCEAAYGAVADALLRFEAALAARAVGGE